MHHVQLRSADLKKRSCGRLARGAAAADLFPTRQMCEGLDPMSLLAIKLIVTPLVVLAATLAARRWGDAVGGWLVGLPLTSAPVSVFLAIEQGPAFAAQAADGSIAGVVSQAAFCLATPRWRAGARRLRSAPEPSPTRPPRRRWWRRASRPLLCSPPRSPPSCSFFGSFRAASSRSRPQAPAGGTCPCAWRRLRPWSSASPRRRRRLVLRPAAPRRHSP
jgi:hypothetical protein